MIQYVLYLCTGPSVRTKGIFLFTIEWRRSVLPYGVGIITLNNDGNKIYNVNVFAVFNIKYNMTSEQLLYMENTLTDPFVKADAVGRLAHGLSPGDQL